MKLTTDSGQQLRGEWQLHFVPAFGGTVVHLRCRASGVPNETVSLLRRQPGTIAIVVSDAVPIDGIWPVTSIDADWRWCEYNGWHVLTIAQEMRPALFAMAKQG